MEPALKQRLLGAVVLIALAIIFLPMLFSGSAPKQESVTSNMEIPPQPTREFETRVLTVDAASKDASRPPVAQARVAEPVASVDTGIPPRVEALPESTAPVTPVEPSLPASTMPAPEKPATVEQQAAGTAADGRYLVHLGVYAAAGNASDLVTQLKKSGFRAFVESVDFNGKPAKRVRVGPFSDRAEAEAARIRIKQIRGDVPSSIVGSAEDAKADVPATAIASTAAGAWAVQLGAFGTEADANKLNGRLRAAGFAGFVDKFNSEGKTLWRVRAGPELERGNAQKLRDRIKEKLNVDGLVVTQP